MLLLIAAVSMMTTGCSDDDDDSGSGGTGSNPGGLGGQTYAARLFVGDTKADLVIVTRGGSRSSAAATAGMLPADLAAGPADGLLVFDNGLRELLTGSYDPGAAEGPTLTVSGRGGVDFEGDATSTVFSGTLKVNDVENSVLVNGFGRQENAPLIHLLGTWQHSTDFVANCGSLGTFTLNCAGFTRLRKTGQRLRMDTYESCGDEPFECSLSGPALTDGGWSGLDYSEGTSSTEDILGCRVEINGTLGMSVDTQSLSSSMNGTLRFLTAACLPAGTECPIERTMTATRCIDCWPLDCTDGL